MSQNRTDCMRSGRAGASRAGFQLGCWAIGSTGGVGPRLEPGVRLDSTEVHIHESQRLCEFASASVVVSSGVPCVASGFGQSESSGAKVVVVPAGGW